jgi:hypothetical protein
MTPSRPAPSGTSTSPPPAAGRPSADPEPPRDELLNRVQFLPPPGWHAVPLSLRLAAAHLAGLWTAPTPPRPDVQLQTVNLVIEPFGGTIDDYLTANERNIRAAEPGVLLSEPTPELLCGSTPAYLEHESVGLTDGHRIRVEQMFIVTAGHGYVATYTYDETEAIFPAAEAALASLCVRPGILI